jgi:hypothetical protein
MADVFISYKRENRDVAEEIDAARRRAGYRRAARRPGFAG